MMNAEASMLNWLALPAALFAFVLPGWQCARALALPSIALSSFLLSAAGWFALVLGLQFLGLPLTRETLVPLWLAFGLLATLWRRRARAISAEFSWSAPPRADWPWLPAIVIGLVAIVARAALDPLHGWDTSFRWDWLARVIIAQGNFDFYPPRVPADFELYAWPDGMPPLVPLLNLWIYLACGSTAPALIAGRVIAEVLLAAGAVSLLARSLRGPRAGWPAIAVLFACPLFLWSATMAQETALTAIAAASLAFFCGEYIRGGDRRHAFCAGLAGALAALCRDYTAALAIMGAGLVLVRPGDRRAALALYALPLLVAAAPWYVRNWALTGNPVFPVTLGVFPGNAFLDVVLKATASQWSFAARSGALGTLGLTLVCVAGAALALGVPGLARAGRRGLIVAALLVAAASLWAWSASSTAGGWNYSLRVLAPAVALLASAAGFLGAAGARVKITLGLILALFAADAARRSWLLPFLPRTACLPYSFAAWREQDQGRRQLEGAPLWPFLARQARSELVLVDSTVVHTLLIRAGGRASTLFSPVAAPLFDPAVSYGDCLARLRAQGVRLLVLTVMDPVTYQLRPPGSPLAILSATPPDLGAPGLHIYDLARLASQPTSTP